ncbi:signal peptidase I T [Anaerotignum neopropionicum]|uniref:Signal peptidase I n=1 Tax=Anaerotignum neopropionicum TaxID=36847 RepID=A0A136WE63_9FIRM|nr:signal peptidase I [Anaerotignum neopropionicum]KXL52639.1 signal peptidase I T [Anaerotignum neopropionicum]
MEQMQEQSEQEPLEEKSVKKKEVFSWLQLIIMLAFVLVLRTFVFGTIYVKGSSMVPNFHHGDLVFINKLATSISAPKQGDIVICQLNADGQREKIIKRVVGLPGDEIDIVWNEDSENVEYSLYVNDELIEEPFLEEPMMTNGDMDYPFTVPEGSYFVMGDNRNASIDSRRTSIGAIKKKDLVGKVIFRLYPFDQFGSIS